MDFIQPRTWDEALSARAAVPGALPLAGGTDVMVEVNFDARRPDALLDLTRIPELSQWAPDNGQIRLGAGVTYTQLIRELGPRLPGLAMAARTVGSPQIRNRGTVGGNLGAASPAGDCHPPLLAAGAEIEVASTAGTRRIPADRFFAGVKQNALAPDELIVAILIPPAPGPQQFSKIGTRNAMVIAVASFCIGLDPASRTVGTGIGSAAPTPRPATDAGQFLAAALDDAGLWESRGELPETVVREFGERVRAAARPIDDVRGTAAYRLHALAVMARRTLTWAWNQYRDGEYRDGGGGGG